MNELENLRAQIDAIDEKVKQLLLSRFEIVNKIGELKKEQGSAIYAPAREEQVLNSVLSGVSGKNREALLNVYREIISNCKKLQE